MLQTRILKFSYFLFYIISLDVYLVNVEQL